MNLIIDTSSDKMRLILSNKSQIKSFIGNSYSKCQEHLLPEIDSLLCKNNKKLKDIDLYGVVVGPGSFTGIRLAVTTVKAFCFVEKNKKIVPINLLDLLGFVLKKNNKEEFYVIVKCTSSKSYVGYFNHDFKEFKVMKNEDIAQINCENMFGFNGVNIFNKKLKLVEISDEDYVKYINNANRYVDYKGLEPIYMALSQAEEELLKRENNV